MFGELRDWAEEMACRAGLDGLPSRGRLVAWSVACVALGAAAWLWWGPSGASVAVTSQQTPAAAATSTVSASASATPAVMATVTVHVVGEVRHPGVYRLPGGSRATDAVSAAGGLLGDADQAAVNLARVVADGEQIAVPKEGQAAAGTAGATTGAASGTAGGKIDLNTATAEQLDTLPGVGPATAQKIVADRTANGPFRSVEDLLRVPGIGPAKLEALKDLVTAG
jgi:competence protein ComEA